MISTETAELEEEIEDGLKKIFAVFLTGILVGTTLVLVLLRTFWWVTARNISTLVTSARIMIKIIVCLCIYVPHPAQRDWEPRLFIINCQLLIVKC